MLDQLLNININEIIYKINLKYISLFLILFLFLVFYYL